MIDSTGRYEWTAEQCCGECGNGPFVMSGSIPTCTECGHEHEYSELHLDSGEEFFWATGVQPWHNRETLHVGKVATDNEEE